MEGKGALSGIVVIDASNFVFGPVATQMLGDMGADVIKIEPPEGDPTRGIGASHNPGMGSFFLNLNRNKRSVVLDLKSDAGRQDLRRLLATADVFVHNMRSAALGRLGLAYEALAAEFPRLVHASAQGFGSGGDYFDRPAYDDVIQGLSGVAGINAAATGTPSYWPALISDKLCGVYLAHAITTALLHRERTGQAQKVEVPMFETMTAFNLLEHLADGVFAAADGSRPGWRGYSRVQSSHHRPLATKDGYISLVANTDGQWRRLFDLIGRPELANDPRFSTLGNRIRNIGELYEIIEQGLARHTSSRWLEMLEAADVPAGPIHGMDDLREDAHLKRAGFFQTLDHPTEGPLVMPDVPLRFSASPGSVRLGPPMLGEHNGDLLGEPHGGGQTDEGR